MKGNIEGKTEHVINRKARQNGQVTNSRLSLVKSYTKPITKKKIKNIFKVQNDINVKNGNTSKTCTVSNVADLYTVTIGGGSFDVEVTDFTMIKNIEIKNGIKNII